jgi:hypothetical protein
LGRYYPGTVPQLIQNDRESQWFKGNIETKAIDHAVVLLAVIDWCKVPAVVVYLDQLSASGMPPNRGSLSGIDITRNLMGPSLAHPFSLWYPAVRLVQYRIVGWKNDRGKSTCGVVSHVGGRIEPQENI